ncbi:MAG: hypothetical protein OEV49_15055 [candidate division Zixibacteria bacterium]|nr:hypothetical protein [candidate division Zixibacteria bacterium]MDH3938780.1 hypothetical protein [candidate division Zixibacteria bacterium]MDH4032935.1 hypothetical protein [candidate division Zixibacteria bacterium]
MPEIKLDDISLRSCKLTERVTNLRNAYFMAMPEICVERPDLITEYSERQGLNKQKSISVLDKARLYRHVLERRKAVVRHHRGYAKGMKPFAFKDTQLFAGSTTSKFKGVPIYPEFLALALWPELWSIRERVANPFQISDEDVNRLNYDIFPRWINSNINELARSRCFQKNLDELGREKYAPELSLFEKLVFYITTKVNCISHTIPDFSKAIRLGLRKMIVEAEAKKLGTADSPQKDFYQSLTEVLEGVISYSHNLAAEARKLAEKETDDDAKQELLALAEIHERVPEAEAKTFREGLTTVWLCWIAIHLENPNVGLSLGRLDQVLYPLYRRDIDSGKLTVEEAVELLCCLWLKIGDHVPCIPETGEQLFGGAGSNQAITIGGVDEEGNDAVNDLTYVMLRATELMKLRDPNLNGRYYRDVNKPAYLERLCAVNIETGATPALHNDKAVIHALTSKGETIEQARDYGVIGCVEPGSNGRFYGHTASILMNLTSVLELTLYNGRHRHTGMDHLISVETGNPTDFGSFDDFKKAFETQARWLIKQSTTLNNILGTIHQDFYPTPILSAFFEGPWDKGKDIIQGGAVINSSGVTIIGLSDTADSLSAIQKYIFDEKRYTFEELLHALKNDFKDAQEMQTRLANEDKTPKYGNDDDLADGNVTWIARLLDSACNETTTYRGGRYRVGYWTMTNHAGFGRLTQALPNGRKAGENFTSGITPVSKVTPTLTKALHSVARQPAELLSNGVALNFKYTPEPGSYEQMLKNFVASVEGYFAGNGDSEGGMEIQFNITNHDTFVEAMKNPEKHSELLVRVSGYTAYFKDLNPRMQKEIVDRTEYLLSSGKSVDYPPVPLPGDE